MATLYYVTVSHYIQQSDNDTWLCKSQNKNGEEYKITHLSHECNSDDEHFHCWESECLNLCRCMYNCTCCDYANGHLCKHIHRVHSTWIQDHLQGNNSDDVILSDIIITNNLSTDLVLETSGEIQTEREGNTKINLKNQSINIFNHILGIKSSCLTLLDELRTEILRDDVQPFLETVKIHLSNALSIAKTAAIQQSGSSFQTKEIISPGEKFRRQPNFFRTCAKPGKRKAPKTLTYIIITVSKKFIMICIQCRYPDEAKRRKLLHNLESPEVVTLDNYTTYHVIDTYCWSRIQRDWK